MGKKIIKLEFKKEAKGGQQRSTEAIKQTRNLVKISIKLKPT